MQDIIQETTSKRVPSLMPGMTVRVHQKIKEGGKERIQVFEGLIIRLNPGKLKADKTFTIRKIVSGVGVEKIFPLYSPNIAKIEIKKKAKIRRAKLYYMRELRGKAARLREEHVHGQDVEEEEIEKAVEELAEQKAKEEALKAAEEGTVDAVEVETEAVEDEKAPAEVVAESPAEPVSEGPEKVEAPTEEKSTE